MNIKKYFIAGKDYIHISAADSIIFSDTDCTITLCDRLKGVGADGIFTFQQNNTKNTEIRGLLQNGQIMRDFSSASICACFDIISKTDATNITFLSENKVFSEIKCVFSDNKASVFYRFPSIGNDKRCSVINRRTEIGNRILTVTPVYLSGIHGVHFTECINQLDINYLGRLFSQNSLFDKQGNFILAQKSDRKTYEIDFYENRSGCRRPALSAFIATALAAVKTGRHTFNEQISIISGGNCVNVICNDENSFEIICEIRKIADCSI